MKKINLLFFVFIVILTTSCTKSDGEDSSRTISAKIDGTLKYFDNIIVETVVEADYTDYIIKAKQTDDNTKTISISLEKGTTGNECIYYIQYYNSNDYFEGSFSNADINTNVSENSISKILATFSGNLQNEDGGFIQVNQGIININL